MAERLTQISIARRGRLTGDLLVVTAFDGETPNVEGLPERWLSQVGAMAGRAPSAKAGRLQFASGEEGAGIGTVALHGLGRREEWEWVVAERWLTNLAAECQRLEARRLVLVPPAHPVLAGSAGVERLARALALSGYRFREFQSADGSAAALERVTLVAPPDQAASWRRDVEAAQVVAEAVAWSRDLANTPPNVATPEWMAERARQLAGELRMKVQVLGPKQLEQKGMRAILAVGGGSRNPPRLVRLEWGQGKPTVALVGKGITFDTGGISIKPSSNMEEMKWDKCGACTVLGIARAAAKLELPGRFRAYLPFAENMPDGAAYRPGDIVRCANGKTVEIINTDAEGRLILAEALAWAASAKPDALLEFSTLTGGAVVALGQRCAALFSPDDRLAEELLSAAEAAGERLWRMPLWREFREQMKGEHADLKNSASRWGSAATAAAFLSQFIDGVDRWAHCDIAGPAYVGKNGKGPRGATGYGVASTLEWLRRQAEGR